MNYLFDPKISKLLKPILFYGELYKMLIILFVFLDLTFSNFWQLIRIFANRLNQTKIIF